MTFVDKYRYTNIEILQRYQSNTLRSLINAPWYVIIETIHRDLKIPTVKDEIHKTRSRYNTRVNNQLPHYLLHIFFIVLR